MKLKLKRFIALFIDIKLIEYSIKIPIEALKNYTSSWVIRILLDTIAILLFLHLFLNKDSLIGYESIGKKIMHLKIYKNNKRIKDKKMLVKRNVETMWYSLLYPITVIINNQSQGDMELETVVK